MRLTTRAPLPFHYAQSRGLLWRDYDAGACCLLCATYVYANVLPSGWHIGDRNGGG